MIDTFTNPEYFFFVGKFALTNLLFSLCVFMILHKVFAHSTTLSTKALFFISLGLGPGLSALILYYLYLLVPGISAKSSFLIVTLVFLVPGLFAIREIKTVYQVIKDMVLPLWKLFPGLYKKIVLFFIICFLGLTFIYLNYYTFSKIITEHDTLEYASQGKIFFKDKQITYNETRYDEASGFFYVGLHGFTYPLLATWERTMNETLGWSGDQYFRNVNMYFGTLILFLVFLYLYKYSALLAIVTFVTTFITYGFFETYMKYHIDHIRIFYLVCAILLLYECVREPGLGNLFLFALLLGLQVNSHSLGALVGIIELGVFFFFIRADIKKRFLYTFSVVALMLFFGAIHYVLDVVTGTGWIFQELKFY